MGRSSFERPPSVIRGETEGGGQNWGGALKKCEGAVKKSAQVLSAPHPLLGVKQRGGGQNLRWGGQVLSAPRLLLGVKQRGAVKIEDRALKF